MREAIYPGKNVKTVTCFPGWYMRLKGTSDSKQGQGVCEKCIEKLYERLGTIESDEVVGAENALFAQRKKAAVILAGLADKQKQIQQIPECADGCSVEEIRESRKKIARLNCARADFASAVKELTMIQEIIVNTETVLDERIMKARKRCNEKVAAYIEGIHCGKLKSFEFQKETIEDKARQIYHEKHDALDLKIRKTVEAMQNMEVAE